MNGFNFLGPYCFILLYVMCYYFQKMAVMYPQVTTEKHLANYELSV